MTGLRWGILATGGIAGAFASDLRTAGLDLVAVGSRSQESADAFAARIDIDTVWYSPTTFRLVLPDGTVQESYTSEVEGRGMQFQALAAERLVSEGTLAGDILPIAESVAIMGTLDEIRAQIGVRYPREEV